MLHEMRTADFDYELPENLIAQHPAARRDDSRLLVLHRNSGAIEHRGFRDLLQYLQPADVLVLNDSRVIPARLRGRNLRSGGHFEVLLLEQNGANDWWVLLRPGRRAGVGTRIGFRNARDEMSGIEACVTEINAEGHRRLCFSGIADIRDALTELGEVPLPPYIHRADSRFSEADRARYQSVFAQPPGSVAAPTAGLHFTEELLKEIRALGVEVCFVTLHVGLGTFAPVKVENLDLHVMHEERFCVNAETTRRINECKAAGRRVIAVGTTSLRAIEGLAAETGGRLEPKEGRTRLFIRPPHDFKIADALLTNFHLPRSTLLMLISAFAASNKTTGRELVLRAYREAIERRYRFFSYGDAMLII